MGYLVLGHWTGPGRSTLNSRGQQPPFNTPQQSSDLKVSGSRLLPSGAGGCGGGAGSARLGAGTVVGGRDKAQSEVPGLFGARIGLG